MEPPAKKARYNFRNKVVKKETQPPRYFTRSVARALKAKKDKDEEREREREREREKSRKTRAKQMDIMKLNTHCILEIFEYLNLYDLANIAETNTRFRSLAKFYATINHKTVDFANFMGRPINLEKMNKIFRNFGESFQRLIINRNNFAAGLNSDRNIFEPINKYCRETLTELVLVSFGLTSNDTMILQRILGNLEGLTLFNCNVTVNVNVLTQLQFLNLAAVNSNFVRECCQKVFPHLETFELYYAVNVDEYFLLEFIRNHPHLRSLSIAFGDSSSIELLNTVCRHLDNLEVFKLNRRIHTTEQEFCLSLQLLGSINTLKKVALHCNDFPIENLLETFVTNNTSIEYLHLKRADMNSNDFTNIVKLSRIKTLKLQMVDLVDVNQLFRLKNLPSLKEFHVQTGKKIKDEMIVSLVKEAAELFILKIDAPEINIKKSTYEDLLEIVKKRPNGVSLEITLYGNGQAISVPKEIVSKNEKWVQIHTIHRLVESLFDEFDAGDDFFDGDFFDDDDDDDHFRTDDSEDRFSDSDDQF